MKVKRKIMVVVPSISISGGRERVISNFALNLCNDFDFLFVVMDNNLIPFFPLPGNIKLVGVDSHMMKDKTVNDNKLSYLRDIIKLRKVLLKYKAYKVIIGVESTYINTFLGLASCGLKRFILAHEHTLFEDDKRHGFWTKLRDNVYKLRINKVVTLTNREKLQFQKIASDIDVIPNAVTFSNPQRASLENKTILAVGRFSHEKGFDLLLEALVPVVKKHPDWCLKIIGTGTEEVNLRAQVTKYNIQNNVNFEPPTKDIQKEYINSSLYVLSSRNEAFPMVLIESMAYGLPAVCFDCATGPQEIVRNGEDGILVQPNDVTGLGNAIITLIEDDKLRKQMGFAAFNNIKRFSSENIYKDWVKLLNNI